jgi:hypothetical protein
MAGKFVKSQAQGQVDAFPTDDAFPIAKRRDRIQ